MVTTVEEMVMRQKETVTLIKEKTSIKKGCFRPKAFFLFFFSETATKVEKSRVLRMYKRFLTGKTRMMNY